MAHQKLTDRPGLTSPQLNDVVHVVDVSDTTADAAGNSKQAALTLIRELFLAGGNTSTPDTQVLTTKASGAVDWTHIADVLTEELVDLITGTGGVTVANLTGTTSNIVGDLNDDGQVGATDLLLLLSGYGEIGEPPVPIRVDWDTNQSGYTTVATTNTNLSISSSYNASVLGGYGTNVDLVNKKVTHTRPAAASNLQSSFIDGTLKVYNTVADITIEVTGKLTRTNALGSSDVITRQLFAGILTEAKDSGTPHELDVSANFGSVAAPLNGEEITDLDFEIVATTSGEGTVSMRMDQTEMKTG